MFWACSSSLQWEVRTGVTKIFVLVNVLGRLGGLEESRSADGTDNVASGGVL